MATVSPSLSDRLGLFSIELKSKCEKHDVYFFFLAAYFELGMLHLVNKQRCNCATMSVCPSMNISSSLIWEKILQVITSIAELNPDAAAKMWDEIFGKVVFELVHSNHSHERLGGVTVIGGINSI